MVSRGGGVAVVVWLGLRGCENLLLLFAHPSTPFCRSSLICLDFNVQGM